MSGRHLALLSLCRPPLPPSPGCLSGKGRWGWHSRFLSCSPSPSPVILSRTAGPSVCSCPFWSKTGSHILLEGGGGGKGGESQILLVWKWKGGMWGAGQRTGWVSWQAASSQPCPCRPSGHPDSAHRPRSSLCCCGTSISARALFSPRNVTRTLPAARAGELNGGVT